MYKVLGSDGREYGPVGAEQVRHWFTQGRVTRTTLVQGADSTEWRPLVNFPELLMAAPPFAPQMAGYDERKSRLAAGLLGIFLGGFGVHRFYLGYIAIGVVQIIVTIVTCGIGALWGFVEGILIISNAGITTDEDGRPLRE